MMRRKFLKIGRASALAVGVSQGSMAGAIPPKVLFTYWELDGAIGQEVAKS